MSQFKQAHASSHSISEYLNCPLTNPVNLHLSQWNRLILKVCLFGSEKIVWDEDHTITREPNSLRKGL